MNSARRNLGDGFGLSFLDVLCCGLGAAILLLLIVKHEEPGLEEADWLAMLEPEMLEIQQAIEGYESENEVLKERITTLKKSVRESEQGNAQRNRRLTQQQKKLIELNESLKKK